MLAATLTAAVGCHDVDDFDNDVYGNFDSLWQTLDEHYCFFAQKGVDWEATGKEYRARLSPEMTRRELFEVCADMLATLRDGHTNLSSAFETSYYKEWWSLYPQNFSERLIEQSYFNFNYKRVAGLLYGILPQNIGYVRIASFSTPVGEGNIDSVINEFAACNAMIVDVRDNGGGELTNVEMWVSRFIERRSLMGYIRHKTGPGHNDFSEPYAYYVDPVGGSHLRWGKGVAVLTNRSTFSAANNFVSFMRNLPMVTIVGATTGGGSGMPFSSEMPCGWAVRFSGCPVTDTQGRDTEFGISPTDGFAVDMDVDEALRGHDTILDRAISIFSNN